jgi:hypothetical protein
MSLTEAIAQPLIQKPIQSPFAGQHRIQITLLAPNIDFIKTTNPTQDLGLSGVTV